MPLQRTLCQNLDWEMCFVYVAMPKRMNIMKIESSERQVNDYYWYVHVDGLIPSEGHFVSHGTCVGVLMQKLSKLILINFKFATKEIAYTQKRICWLFQFIDRTQGESFELVLSGYKLLVRSSLHNYPLQIFEYRAKPERVGI